MSHTVATENAAGTSRPATSFTPVTRHTKAISQWSSGNSRPVRPSGPPQLTAG